MEQTQNFTRKFFNSALLIPAQALFAAAAILSLVNMLILPVQIGPFLLAFGSAAVFALVECWHRRAFFVSYGLTLAGFGYWLYRAENDRSAVLLLVLAVAAVGFVRALRNTRLGLSVVVLVLLPFTAVPFFFGKDNTLAVFLGVFAVLWMLPLFAHNKKRGGITVSSSASKGLLRRLVCCLLIIISISGLLTLAIPSRSDPGWFNRMIADMDIMGNLNTAYREYDLEETGFSFGGPVYPSSDKELTVQTDVRLPLRSKIYTEYTGHGWKTPNAVTMYLDSIIFETTRREVFDLERPERESLPADFFTNYEMRIKPAYPMYTVPIPYRYDTIKFEGNQLTIFDQMGDVFTYGKYTDAYTVKGNVPDTDSPGFDAWMTENADKFSESPEKMDALREVYCQLPDTRSHNQATVAESMSGNGNSYEKAKNLAQWLSTNFTYSQLVPYPDMSADFVDDFLDRGSGYCVYFATAMTVLLRYQGIPARYVTGYVLPVEHSNGNYDVTGMCGHAWTEVYFEGIGWIPFDPTASGSAADMPLFLSPGQNPSEPPRQSPNESPNTDVFMPEPVKTISVLPYLISFLLLTLLLVSYVLLHRYRTKKSFTSAGLADWYAIEKALGLLGRKRLPAEPFSSFAERTAPFFQDKEMLPKAAEEAEMLLFHPNGEHAGNLTAARKIISAELKRKNKLKWFAHVILYP